MGDSSILRAGSGLGVVWYMAIDQGESRTVDSGSLEGSIR